MEVVRSTGTNPNLSQIQRVIARFGWLILLAWTLAFFLLVNLALPSIVSPKLFLYVLQPALWSSVALLALFLRVVEGGQVRLLENRGLIIAGAMIGGIQLAMSVLFGLFSGFGRSPYAHGPSSVLLNLWFVLTQLVGIETARWYLGTALGRRSHALGFLVAWLLPMFWIVPLGKYGLLGGSVAGVRVAGETFLPAASENLMAAYLAISGGPLASIAYRGVLQAFEWFFPILPDLSWMAAAFVGVLVPVLGLVALSRQDASSTEAVGAVKRGGERASAASWMLVGVLAVGVIWLNTGFLGVRPSLVSGNSMNPVLYPGDVIITRGIAPEKIQVGDVIRFPRDGMDYVHRVTSINRDGGEIVFTTRGDNNNVDDDPVPASLVQGKIILTLPKIGWVSIYLRQAVTWVGGLL